MIAHRTLEKVLKLQAGFDQAVVEAERVHPSERILPLAFAGAALSRTAYASRLFTILERALIAHFPEQTELLTFLRDASGAVARDVQSRLTTLESSLVFLEASSDFDQELKAELLRFLLDTRKYLAPAPTDIDLKVVARYHAEAERSFGVLKRPAHAAALDAFDVYSNSAALYWARKLPLPGVFPKDMESTATKESREAVWAKLDGFDAGLKEQWGESIRNAFLPLRYRLTLQRMNFVQLKMRLLARMPRESDAGLFESLHAEYQELVRSSARLYQLLEKGKEQPDYYGVECSPIVQFMSQL